MKLQPLELTHKNSFIAMKFGLYKMLLYVMNINVYNLYVYFLAL